jgi:hypothetical protein
MNKLIKILDQQAVDYAMSVCDANGVYKGKEYLTVVKEMFAELIVRECRRVPFTMWYNKELNADIAVKIEHKIRDHFGVEE